MGSLHRVGVARNWRGTAACLNSEREKRHGLQYGVHDVPTSLKSIRWPRHLWHTSRRSVRPQGLSTECSARLLFKRACTGKHKHELTA